MGVRRGFEKMNQFAGDGVRRFDVRGVARLGEFPRGAATRRGRGRRFQLAVEGAIFGIERRRPAAAAARSVPPGAAPRYSCVPVPRCSSAPGEGLGIVFHARAVEPLLHLGGQALLRREERQIAPVFGEPGDALFADARGQLRYRPCGGRRVPLGLRCPAKRRSDPARSHIRERRARCAARHARPCCSRRAAPGLRRRCG